MPTKTLAKFMGLSIVLTVLGLVANKDAAISTMNALFSDAPLMWITGVFTMMFGLGIVIAHNRWSGGALTVLVTIYGWIALIKGLTFVWLSPAMQQSFWQAMHFDRFFYAYCALPIVLGAYLIYGGFKSSPSTS